ncbi:MAG TPA: D-glycero-beta-D-manno-heptose 1-phosphate adenylyltransferase [Bacteroidales bacterium]|nr:D-glycero-beta-D-manno-heptose 1-phosphate adenylyltransferase [Bacteroidales bacterium]HPE55197.1 D-glycero-beta-D-manno-heptose 1-phosphate adenylyltransferase [Bacteroidales bacterium]
MNFHNLIRNKIIPENKLPQLLSYWRFKGFKIVFTNGCFDILHLGHVDYLSKARSLGDILMIGLNTDDSVTRLKGNDRPINKQEARAQMLASMIFVDAVVYFGEDTPYELIKIVQPDILVKGSDYKPEDIVGADIVLDKGGTIETIDFLDGYSTSGLIEKLRK